ncbi:MAG: cation diffusion facilitator family transporter [Thermoproteota archaeon]
MIRSEKVMVKNNTNIKKIAYNVLAISSVILFEGTIGLVTGSLSLLSDAAHSCVDLVSSIVSFTALRISLRPADENHLYGHEKIEYIGTMTGGAILLFLGILLMYESIINIVNIKEKIIENTAYIALAYVFLVETFRVVNSYTGKIGKGKSLLTSELYHAAADMSGTFIALAGVYFNNLGIKGADEAGGLLISFLMMYGSLKLMHGAAMELTDYIPKEVLPKVTKAIEETKGVISIKEIRARKSGEDYYIDTTITVHNKLEIEEAHEIASNVEKNIKKVLPKSDVTVHVEPEENKNSSLIKDGQTPQQNSSMPYYRLTRMTEYKAVLKEIPATTISEAYTSKTCHLCECENTREI